MSDKLQGDAYLDFWRKRIAKGPEEVAYTGSDFAASEAHADRLMALFEPALGLVEGYLENQEKPVIVELGCGWGRMMSRMAKRFPNAFIHGYDICEEAIGGAFERLEKEGVGNRVHLAVDSKIPENLRRHIDLVYTCTCLQHITDDTFFTEAMMSIREGIRPETGFALLFENTHRPEGPAGRHVRFRGAMDFLGWFAKPEGEFEYLWEFDRSYEDHGELHQAMLLRRNRILTR